ncbi:hypothetical protein BH23PLA1_BH23PLA1_30630 [soil metagenome]
MKLSAKSIAIGALLGGLLLAFGLASARGGEEGDFDPAEAVRAVREAEAWVDRIHSFRLQAVSTFHKTPEGVERTRSEFEQANPGVEPDPERFPDLRALTTTEIELAFAENRQRYRAVHRDQYEDVRLWNGRRFVSLSRSLQPGSERVSYRLTAEPGNGFQPVFWNHLFAFRAGPRAERWYSDGSYETVVKLYGQPEDFVDAGLADFRGIACRRLNHLPSWTSLYISVEDGRLQGSRIGALAMSDMDRRYLEAINALGHDFESIHQAVAWRDALSEAGRRELERGLARLMDQWIEYIWESALGDYQEVAPGCWMPMTQESVRREVDEEGRVFNISINRVEVTKVSVNQDLPDDLFTTELEEGALVHDETHDPPLTYEIKAARTPAEWAEIIAKAEQQATRDQQREQAQAALVGQPAPEFPEGATWLNGGPLTWEDLKGQYVVLEFWADWCGPCRSNLASLRGAGATTRGSGMTYIGIHTAGSEPPAVREVAESFGLDFPTCIDVPTDEGHPWGSLYAAYAVDRIPHAVLVDPEGQILASGELSEMVLQATERLRR